MLGVAPDPILAKCAPLSRLLSRGWGAASQEEPWGPVLDPGSQPGSQPCRGSHGAVDGEKQGLSVCLLHPGHRELDLVQIALYRPTPYSEHPCH